MWLLGSTSQVKMMMMMEESPPARSVQSPGSRVHSIEAILGFKEDTAFHKSTSTELVPVQPGPGGVPQRKKAQLSDSCDSKSEFTSEHVQVFNDVEK